MKILYDHQIFSLQKYGGISRYFYELTKEFDKINGIYTSTSLLVSDNHYISDKKLIKHFKFLPDKEFKGKNRLIMILNQLNTIHQLKKQNLDLFHPTYYDPYFLKYIGDKPFVITVYDMIHEKFSKIFSSNDKTSQNKRLLVKKASKVIAISESTKKDLIELFGIDESKIKVVYLGNSMLPEPNSKTEFDIPKKYILFVGSRFGYKNFDRFFVSVTPLLQENQELSLVCAGGGSFTSSELTRFRSLMISDQIYQYNLDDSTLAYLYQNALAFIFPSLYEGFGIPVLESFACSCPLLCSNTSSLPEIAGDGACYFDPYSEESIKSAVLKVLEDASLREDLIMKGHERLKKFSWQQTALETNKVYEEVLS